jgi:hypothetical protein
MKVSMLPVPILYIKATVSICPGSDWRIFPVIARTSHCLDLFFFFLMGFVFCDSYYPTNRGGGQHGWRGLARGGSARAGKGRARGNSTGALCTRFTLVY